MLEAHQLTDYQKVDQLLKMKALGAWHPSELLTAMLETCPHHQETNIFFTHLFWCQRPAKLCIMLDEDDYQDVRNLVAKADNLWSLHGQKSSLIATIDQLEEESSVVIAVSSVVVAATAAKVVEATEDNSLQPEVISTSLAASLAANSLGKLPSMCLEARQRPPVSVSLTWLGWVLISASSTGPWVTKPATVWLPTTGRETKPLGACQRHRPWPACLRL